ncbi:MAG: hypothetical protein ACPGVD_05785, partial [Flavobacteriales bacterium]
YLRIIDEGKGYNGYFLSSLKEDYMIQDSIISLPELINFRKGFYAKKKLKLILYVPAKDTINVINEFNDEKAY